LGSGKRVFAVSVLGNNRMDIKNIDVFAKKGKYDPYVVKLPSVEAYYENPTETLITL